MPFLRGLRLSCMDLTESSTLGISVNFFTNFWGGEECLHSFCAYNRALNAATSSIMSRGKSICKFRCVMAPVEFPTVDHLIMKYTKAKYLIYFYKQTCRSLIDYEQDQIEHI